MVWQQVLRVHRSSRQQNDPLVAHRYDEGVVVRTRCATHRFFLGGGYVLRGLPQPLGAVCRKWKGVLKEVILEC